MGVIEDDKLKALAYFLACRMHDFKKIVYSPTVCILERVNSATLIQIRWIMCLRRLIEDENSGHRTLPFSEPTVERQ